MNKPSLASKLADILAPLTHEHIKNLSIKYRSLIIQNHFVNDIIKKLGGILKNTDYDGK